jgi:hypothetical protein
VLAVRKLPLKTRVRHKRDGRVGTVVPYIDPWLGFPLTGQAAVWFDGEPHPETCDIRLLKVIGLENAVRDPIQCGYEGQENACAFVLDGKCGRYSDRHEYLASQAADITSALRVPILPYPDCQTER